VEDKKQTNINPILARIKGISGISGATENKKIDILRC
jgi:hypothetical protein